MRETMTLIVPETGMAPPPATICDNEASNQKVGVEQPTAFILKLYQMINGAPDEVIAWTPSGDAFIIGSDLKRLENETLSQFFRHNRFQSLVRQLNFYSFRKINRERNMWVYKHDLFHRDRPQDLTLLRRRNGHSIIDGRRRLQQDEPPTTIPTTNGIRRSDDDSTASLEVDSGASNLPTAGKKRCSDIAPSASLPSPDKRPVLIWHSQCPSGDGDRRLEMKVVDTSMMQPVPITESEDSDDQESASSMMNEQSKVEEQTLIVSEVASQLAKHARNAVLCGRQKRGAVTPPSHTSFSSGSLLTYDDEYIEDQADVDCLDFTSNQESTVPPQFLDGSTDTEDDVLTVTVASGIMQKLLEACDGSSEGQLSVDAKVAIFCMSTNTRSALESNYLKRKICDLLTSCDRLSTEFRKYHRALNPFVDFFLGESEVDTARVFRTFAINSMHNLMDGVSSGTMDCSFESDNLVDLESSIDRWRRIVFV